MKCPILINEKKRCNYCNNLFPYLKSYKYRSSINKNKYIGFTLTPKRRSMLNKLTKNKKILQKSNFR